MRLVASSPHMTPLSRTGYIGHVELLFEIVMAIRSSLCNSQKIDDDQYQNSFLSVVVVFPLQPSSSVIQG